MHCNRFISKLVILMACLLVTSVAQAQQYFYVGADGGDFFDENNWNSVFDSTDVATSLATVEGNILIDDTAGAIYVDLVIDPTSSLNNGVVQAAGQVDFDENVGNPGQFGSLELRDGSAFTIVGSSNQLEFNAGTSFLAVNSTLTVGDDITFAGMTTIDGGSVISLTDDVEFQNDVFDITGTVFSAGDNINFDQDGALAGSIVGATFNMEDRLSVDLGELGAEVTLVDATINIRPDGAGDIYDGSGGDAGKLILLGDSVITMDDVRENSELVLGGNSMASLGNGTLNDTITDGSTVTLISRGASLEILATDEDLTARVFNGITGLSYADDDTSWNVQGWNGTDAVTLRLVPEPSSLVLLASVSCWWHLCRKKPAGLIK